MVRKGADGAADMEVASYGYDALGRRVTKTVAGAGGGAPETTWFVHEGIHVIEEIGAGFRAAREFVYGDSIDDPIAMVTPAAGGGDPEYYYYHTDGQGSVVALTNGQGAEEERYSYDAYGAATITDVSSGAVLDRSELGNPFLYTGQRYDPETGFYYYKARYYHPTLGRFLQRDPLGYVDGYNLYAYVNNNPLNWVDPLGLNKDQKDESADFDLGNYFQNLGDSLTFTQKGIQFVDDDKILSSSFKSDEKKNGSVMDAKILGVYRDPFQPGIYSNNPVIYQHQKVKALGWWRSFTPKWGLAGSVASGSLFEGSSKIIVWGSDPKTPTSWGIYTFQPLRTDPVVNKKVWGYSQARISYEEAVNFEVTKEAIEYFYRKREE